VFIGAGPWFHGGPRFHGWVNRRFDPHYGYRGPMPHRGERGQWNGDHWQHHDWKQFHGSEMRDGHGHAYHDNHGHPHGH
jgi:hypothetical protein